MKVLGNLNIKGQVTIVDGTQGNNKVLTSDADGAASWVELSGIVGGMVSDTNTHVSSGQLNGTNLDLLLSDGSSVPSIDLSDLIDDTNLWTKKAVGNNIYRDIGNVGIGLTSPENRLSVKRTIGIMNDDWNNSNGTGSRLLMGLNSTSGDDFSYIQAQDAGGTSNNNLILQRYGGRVGIGTTSPGTNLHILAGEGSDAVIRIEADPDNSVGTETDNPRIEFVQDGGNLESAVGHNLIGTGTFLNALQIANSVSSGGGIVFATDTNNNGYSHADPRMLITGDGNVGIGTLTPSNKLHVAGSAKVTNDIWLGGKIHYPLVDNTQPIVTGYNDTNTKHTAIFMDMDGDDSYLEYGHVNSSETYTQFRIRDNNVGDRFRIYIDDYKGQSSDRIPLEVRGDRVLLSQDGGNVGIGNSNPDSKLHVEGQVKIVDGTEGSDKVLTSDADGLGTWQNISSLIDGMVGDTNNYVTAANIGGNTLILKRNGGLSDITVDLSQFMDDTNTDTYVIGGEIIKGAVDCDHKIRLNLNNGSFIAGAIDVSSLASDNYVSDLTLVGSQLTLKQSNDCGNEKPTFQVDLSPLTSGLNAGGDNDWTVLGNNMHSNPSGLVGIGTNTPTSKLHILDTSPDGGDGTYTLLNLEHSFGDLGQQKVLIDFTLRDTNSNGVPQVRIGAEVGTNGDANSMAKEGSGAFVIHTGLGDSDTTNVMTEKMRVSANGNVGIGTVTPDSKLHIDGQIKIVDGTQSQGKVLTSNADGLASWQTPAGGTSFPVGSIIQFAGDTAPAGWLMCDGSVYDSKTYSALFSVIGVTYGFGDSDDGFPLGEEGDDFIANFMVPNLNGRVPVGRNNNDSDFNNLGETGGKKEETLAASQIPHKSHTHTINEAGSGHYHPIGWVHDGSDAQSGNKTEQRAQNVLNGHSYKHVNVFKDYVITGNHGFTGSGEYPNGHQSDGSHSKAPLKYDTTQGEHSHSMSTGSASNNSNGGPHNNLQPYIVLNYIIYAGV